MKKIKLSFNKYSYSSLSLISSNMAILHKEGISLILIFDLLKELPLNKNYLRSIDNIKLSILEGNSLSDAFKSYNDLYPEFFIGMISMGEKSGNHYEALIGVEKYCDKINFIKNTIKNTLSYPIFILVSCLLLVIFMILYVIPSFHEFYSSLNINEPLISSLCYKLSIFIKDNPYKFLVYLVCWGLVIPYLVYKTFLKDKVPRLLNKIGIYKEFNEFVFISILSIIIKSGVNLSNGLVYSSTSFKNRDLIDRFTFLNSSILKGESISDAIRKMGNYSNYTKSIIKLGEEGGSMDERLESLSIYLEKRLISKINRYMAILQPASVIIMGGFVVIFLFIFILPLFGAILDGGFQWRKVIPLLK